MDMRYRYKEYDLGYIKAGEIIEISTKIRIQMFF